MKGNAISTPAAEGTILPGITRKSIIDIAVDLGYQVICFPPISDMEIERRDLNNCHGWLIQVMERTVSLEELLEADEVFCTGTAVVINPVLSVTYNETK